MNGPLRIATWNVNSLKARLDYVLGWLEARSPDVVCLQELKLAEDKFPFAELEAAGYHTAVHGQPTWNGVAVLSKRPGKIEQKGLPGYDEAGARLITVSFDDLWVTSIYLPNGKSVSHDDYPRKLEWTKALAEHVRATQPLEGRVIIGGDFNITHRDVDSYAPDRLRGEVHHTDAERSALDAFLAGGLVDTYRRVHPDGRMFSWWDYRAGAFHKNHGLRIDYLFATAPLLAATEKVWVDRDYRKKQQGNTPSDHAPVIAEIAGQ